MENQENVRTKEKTIRFFIPDEMKRPSFEEAAKKLQMQNKPLITDDWVAWKAERKEHGMFYSVSVDNDDVELIRAKKGRLFYCFSKLKINLPKDGNRETSGENVKGGGVH